MAGFCTSPTVARMTVIDTGRDQVIATVRRKRPPSLCHGMASVYLPSGPERTVTVLGPGG